jgi:DNA polymerase elongation subunit (family B)
MEKLKGPKVLLFDIETAPMLGYVWSLWENNVSLDQLYKDWHVLSWSAKWLDDPPSKIMYRDQRNAKKIEDDKDLLKSIWKLLDEADIVITQNGKSFDHKKLNARFILQGMQPPSSYRHIDTMLIAKKHFAFTSNKLEYMSNNLCTIKKLKSKKFPGFTLWLECLAGNRKAWKEMERYNKYDVLSLEELYYKLIPWDSSINFNVYHDTTELVCSCGSKHFHSNGYYYTATGKFQRLRCTKCGSEIRGRENLFSKDKRKSLKSGTSRS